MHLDITVPQAQSTLINTLVLLVHIPIARVLPLRVNVRNAPQATPARLPPHKSILAGRVSIVLRELLPVTTFLVHLGDFPALPSSPAPQNAPCAQQGSFVLGETKRRVVCARQDITALSAPILRLNSRALLEPIRVRVVFTL